MADTPERTTLPLGEVVTREIVDALAARVAAGDLSDEFEVHVGGFDEQGRGADLVVTKNGETAYIIEIKAPAPTSERLDIASRLQRVRARSLESEERLERLRQDLMLA